MAELEPSNQSPIFGDIILVVDESGSMSDEHAWIGSAFQSFEDELNLIGIGINQYSLIGYGRTSNQGGPGPILHLNSGTIGDLVTKTSVLIANGNQEDGLQAISFALDNVNFRDNSKRLVILITDDGRRIVDPDITLSSVFTSLVSNTAQLNVVVDATFTNGAIGVDENGVGFLDDGAGGLLLSEGETVVKAGGSIVSNYIELAWSTGAAAFDLNILRAGGQAAVVFNKAFLESKTAEIADDSTSEVCEFAVDPDAGEQSFFCKVEENISAENPVVEIKDLDKITLENTSPDGKTCIHFRISFFTNPQHTSSAFSAFSLVDQKRWFVGTGDSAGFPCQISPSGAVISATSFPSVFYAPEVLPFALMESQSKQDIKIDGTTENSLLCGVTYYVRTESYIGNVFQTIKETTVKFSCIGILRDFWRDNLDAKLWKCSAQGKEDFKISGTSNQAIFPFVAANAKGNFAITWQDFRESAKDDFKQIPDIFYGIWESGIDRFWSSGQGRSDVKAISDAFSPQVHADPADNFVFSGTNINILKRTFCPQPVIAVPPVQAACVFSDDEFFDIDNTNRDADQYLKARIYDQDAKSSYAIADDNVVSVVEDCFTRLDIVGAPGTYAVRLRNEDDNNWSSWISIDSDFPTGSKSATSSSNEPGAPIRTALGPYFIEDNRFIAPWVLSAGNGIKRVCVQILTYFGITKSFCVNVFADISELDYKVEFSHDADFATLVNEFDGFPVINHTGGASSTIINVRVTFNDTKRLEKIDSLRDIEGFQDLFNNDFTFNFMQQGINDQYGLVLSKQEEGVYTGILQLNNSDGIYNKDGLCAIVVNIPNPCTKLRDIVCVGGNADFLNVNQINDLQDFNVDYANLSNLNADKIFEVLKSSKLARVTDLESFKQLYAVDDPRFTFGNPKFFIKK